MAEAKYTWGDIIIYPTSDRAKEAVGKQVYYSQFPNVCLLRANNDDRVLQGILISIDPKNSLGSFIVDGSPYACIIVKKEEPKPEFIPFESADEFLDEYDNVNYSISSGTLENKLLNYGGVWLKSKKDNSLCMVVEICDNGLVICDKKMTISGSIEYNVKMSWAEILADFLFLNGTPCGMNSLWRTDNE